MQSKAGNGTLLVAEHGPWRVMWLQHGVPIGGKGRADVTEADFFQGVTFHGTGLGSTSNGLFTAGALVSGVVGFDYQRVLCAAALPFLHMMMRTEHPVACLVGLGSGCCAAALAGMNRSFVAHALEIDEAIVRAAEYLHRVKLREVDGFHSRPATAGGGVVRVTVADAADALWTAEPGSLQCVVLDAYDGDGAVPPALQSARFVDGVARALAPGGAAVANVWRLEPAERRATDAFARRLAAKIGTVYEIPVPEREGSLVLVAIKAGSGDPPSLEALRLRLRAAATASDLTLEPEMRACIKSSAKSMRKWSGAK
jgi:spermidine synthase